MWIAEYFRAQGRAESSAEISNLKLAAIGKDTDVQKFREKVAYLETELNKYKVREVIDFTVGDPVPTDTEKRRAYVTAVSGLFHEILHPKLKQMIANARKELEDQGNTRELDLQVKGAIFALWELLNWGNLMVGEDKANMAGQDPSSPTDKK